MLKNLVQLDHKIGENTYQFLCQNTAPLHEIKDALCQFMKYVGNIEDQVRANQEAEKQKTSSEDAPDITPELAQAE